MIDPDDIEDLVEVFGELGHTLLIEGFNDCIVGIDDHQRLVYSIEACIRNLVKNGMTTADAAEYFDFNIAGAYMGEYSPVFIYSEL
jgi:hypothetical protein